MKLERRSALEAEGDDVILAEALLSLAAVTEDIRQPRRLVCAPSRRLARRPRRPGSGDLVRSSLHRPLAPAFVPVAGSTTTCSKRAIDIERQHPYRRLSDRADASYAALLKYADDLDAADSRPLLPLLDEARAIGDLSSIAYSLSHLAHAAIWRGRLAQGRAYATPSSTWRSRRKVSSSSQGAHAQYNLGLAMAHQGELDDAHPGA